MDQKKLEDFVAQLGFPSSPNDEEQAKKYTSALINALPDGQQHLFYVQLNIRQFHQDHVDPAQFSTHQEYRQHLLDER